MLGQIPADSIDQHLADTLNAGAGLCDEDAVRVLVNDGPARVRELIALGAQFDRDPDGSLQLAREGGHSHARVVHAGGAATGAEIERALVESTARSAVSVHEHCFAADLIIEHGRCRGATILEAGGALRCDPGHAHTDGNRRRGSTVRHHDEPSRSDRRWHRDGHTRRRRR